MSQNNQNPNPNPDTKDESTQPNPVAKKQVDKAPKFVMDNRGNLCLESEASELNAKYKKQEEEAKKEAEEREKQSKKLAK